LSFSLSNCGVAYHRVVVSADGMAETGLLRLPYADGITLGDDIVASAYRAYWGDLCRYIRRTFGAGPPEPEDVVQEAFAKFAMLEDVGVVANPWGFLRLTAHNVAIDAHRKLARSAAAMHDARIVADNYHDPSAEDVISSREQLQRLGEVI